MRDRKSIAFDFSKATVLMVDANGMCLDVLVAILASFGFRQTHRCADFSAATDVVKRHGVDLIFMDPFPYEDAGYDFVRWLRSERLGSSSTAPVIITSANPHVKLISAARDCGVDYVVAKPFSTSVIIDRIAWVVENEGRRGELMAPAELISNAGSGVELW